MSGLIGTFKITQEYREVMLRFESPRSQSKNSTIGIVIPRVIHDGNKNILYNLLRIYSNNES